jgi:hypothetical protein
MNFDYMAAKIAVQELGAFEREGAFVLRGVIEPERIEAMRKV